MQRSRTRFGRVSDFIKDLDAFIAGELNVNRGTFFDGEPGTQTVHLLDAQRRDAAPSRLFWMKLLARVFRIDISVCA